MSAHQHDDCRKLLGNLSDYIDGELDETLCRIIESHMKECENCRIVVDTLRKTVEIYQDEQQRQDMPEAVRQRLFFKLDLQDYTGVQERS
jgi:predicted anti-sigma-YlaC factor YlaD